MAKKAELETDYTKHVALVKQSHQEENLGNYRAAVATAIRALDHVDGMLQFMSRYQDKKEVPTVESVEIVLEYAPLLFDNESLDRLTDLLKTQRRIEKNTSKVLSESLSAARSLMWDAYHLWNYLENHGVISHKELGEKSASQHQHWQAIVKKWIKMGIVHRNTSKDTVLVTRMDEKVRGKCPSCGATGTSTKMKLLQAIQCPRCNSVASFVLLPPVG